MSVSLRNIGVSWFIGFFVLVASVGAQGIGSWRTQLPFYSIDQVVPTSTKVFGVASGSLFSFSTDDQELRKYGKQEGLNDTQIHSIAYSKETESLVILYQNANVDILSKEGIYNFSAILDKSELSDKTPNKLVVSGKMAYIATAFGLVSYDLLRQESPDSYLIGEVYATCLLDNYLYIATPLGLRRGPVNKNLSIEQNWEWFVVEEEGFEYWRVETLLPFKGAIVMKQKDGGVYYKKGELSGALSREKLVQISANEDELIGLSETGMHIWSDIDQAAQSVDLVAQDVAIAKKGVYWLAQGVQGLSAVQKDAQTNAFKPLYNNLSINSPINNHALSLRFSNNKLLVVGGSNVNNQSHNYPGTFMVLENGTWTALDPDEVTKQVKEKYPSIPSFTFRDVVDAVEDPARPGRYYLSSFGEGLYVFEDFTFKELYNFANSPLVSVLQDNDYNKHHYIRLGGLCFDKENNLHVSINNSVNSLQILSANKEWATVPYEMNVYSPPTKTVLISSRGQKWMNFLRNGELAVIEDNKTPLQFSDDKFTLIKNSLVDQKGETFTYGRIHAIAEDKKGSIWLGTEKGPVVLYSPQNAIKDPNSFYCTRPILPFNDGSDAGFYLLETEQINTIAVDGANRKWMGTERSGVYLVSENGMEILEHFTSENSPLLANLVHSIAINEHTGEVYFATEQGIVSYLGEASEGKTSYKEVQVYPNPVRPEHQDKVTITNLQAGSKVRITDFTGKLVYQGDSKGGMFTWPCVDSRGARVATGIYLVFAATPDGSEGVVSKIMVIK